MTPSQAFFFALALVGVQSVLSYPAAQVDVLSDVIAMEDAYLKYLFQTIQDSGRQPTSNGDINLLPEDSKAFANMVQCAAEETDIGETDSSTFPTRRTIEYNLKGISPTQKLVSFHLVIPSSSEDLFEMSVYTEGESVSPVDTAMSGEKYIDLVVEDADEPAKYRFENDLLYRVTIEIRSPDGQLDDQTLSNILCSLKPMLVIYSYDSDILKNLFYNPDVNVFKRDVSEEETDQQESISLPEPYNSIEEMAGDFCQMHTINLTSFEPLKQAHDLHQLYKLKSPATPTFSFCYGHCKSQGNPERAKVTTRHARLLRDAHPELEEIGISPCCVPTGYRVTELTFSTPGSSVLSMYPSQHHVTGCGCV